MPLRSDAWYAGATRDAYIHRAWMRRGNPADALDGDRPQIAIANTASDLAPCNAHLDEVAQHVKNGVWEAGGVPYDLPVMSLGETQVRPTAMLWRNLAAMQMEEMFRANPVDGLVLLDTEARVAVPRHRRRVGYVFQEDRLFPHLTVRQNLGFGRWFAPDLRGHGQSQRLACAGQERMAADLAELLDLLALSRCFVLGHAGPGSVAECFAYQFPARVRGLILIRQDAQRPASLGGACRQALERLSRRAGPRSGGRGDGRDAPQRRVDRGERDRLGDVVVHAGLEAPLAVAGHRVRGHRDDRDAPAAAGLGGADRRRRLEAAHRRHLHVHEHDVEAALCDRRHRFGAVADHHGVVAQAGEHRRGEPLNCSNHRARHRRAKHPRVRRQGTRAAQLQQPPSGRPGPVLRSRGV